MTASAGSVQRTDVLIGGAGFAGLALAIALRQGLAPSFSVTVVDPALGRASKDGRASAIVAAARRLFETIGVWQGVEAQPILDMVVTDSRLSDVVRPVFLTFEGDVEPGEPFAHMIENSPLIAALTQKAQDEGVVLRSSAVADFERPPDRVDVTLSDGGTLAARLLVAADGAHSAIRERAAIPTNGFSYSQSALVTTVAHERDHQGRAEEHFLPAGPFAILPLKRDPVVGHRSSIVQLALSVLAAGTSGVSACISARSTPSARAACFRSGFRSRARSSPSASPSSAMPPMSFTRSPGRASTWGSRMSPRSRKCWSMRCGSGSIPARLRCSSATSAGGGSTPSRWD